MTMLESVTYYVINSVSHDHLLVFLTSWFKVGYIQSQ